MRSLLIHELTVCGFTPARSATEHVPPRSLISFLILLIPSTYASREGKASPFQKEYVAGTQRNDKYQKFRVLRIFLVALFATCVYKLLIGFAISHGAGISLDVEARLSAPIGEAGERNRDMNANTADDFDNDAAIDAFHEGYDLFRQGKPKPDCPTMADGWLDAQRASQVRVVMPARPEGYYHAPVGAFD